MAWTTDCPNCGRIVSAPGGARGEWLRCPGCSARFRDAAGGGEKAVVSLSELAVGRSRRRGPLADAEQLVGMSSPPRPAPSPGDARRRPRRCGSCDGHVPVGMSICPVCGWDQETGRLVAGRIRVIEPEPVRPPPAPVGMLLVGWGAIAGSVGLGMLLLVRFDWFGWMLGTVCGVLVWLGLYGGVQFLRGFRVRPLAIGLVLAAVLDMVLAFLVPLFSRRGEGLDEATIWRMGFGVGGLLVMSVVAIYLGTEPVRRYFALRRPLFVEPEDEEEWLSGYTTTI